MFTVKADPRALRAYAKRLRKAEEGAWKGPTFRQFASDIEAELDEQFEQGRDPYGSGWAPRKSGGGWPLLNRTGRLKGNRFVQRVAGSDTVTRLLMIFRQPYAGFIHRGTRYMQARKILPDRVLPDAWRAKLQAAFSRELERIVKG